MDRLVDLDALAAEVWRGGWADLNYLIEGEALSEAPEYHHVAGCVAIAEQVADRLRSGLEPGCSPQPG
jgi:hypothetical protein